MAKNKIKALIDNEGYILKMEFKNIDEFNGACKLLKMLDMKPAKMY